MKVVLFCGGLGTRLREHSETIPKPLVNVGSRPILWHLMKYYASFGHTEFILCLGYRGDLIRRFFCEYDSRDTENFIMEQGVCRMLTETSDVPDWNIRFLDTGLHKNIGERLLAAREHLGDDPVFLANYSDQLSDLPMNEHIAFFKENNAAVSFAGVKPAQSFHFVETVASGKVSAFKTISDVDLWVNGGYMVLNQKVFDYVQPGEELVEQPFERLRDAGLLYCYRYNGFWKAMDTFKDKLSFDQMDGEGRQPWIVW